MFFFTGPDFFTLVSFTQGFQHHVSNTLIELRGDPVRGHVFLRFDKCPTFKYFLWETPKIDFWILAVDRDSYKTANSIQNLPIENYISVQNFSVIGQMVPSFVRFHTNTYLLANQHPFLYNRFRTTVLFYSLGQV